MEFSLGGRLGGLVRHMIDSYQADEKTRHVERAFLPSRSRVVQMTERSEEHTSELQSL